MEKVKIYILDENSIPKEVVEEQHSDGQTFEDWLDVKHNELWGYTINDLYSVAMFKEVLIRGVTYGRYNTKS